MKTTLSSKQIKDFVNIRKDIYTGIYYFRVIIPKKGIFPGGKIYLNENQIDEVAKKRLYSKIKRRGKIQVIGVTGNIQVSKT